MKKLIPVLFIIIMSCSPQVDLEQEKEKLLQTDIDFSNRSVEVGNHQAFLEFASPFGVGCTYVLFLCI